jgi:hypothetical protein
MCARAHAECAAADLLQQYQHPTQTMRPPALAALLYNYTKLEALNACSCLLRWLLLLLLLPGTNSVHVLSYCAAAGTHVDLDNRCLLVHI